MKNDNIVSFCARYKEKKKKETAEHSKQCNEPDADSLVEVVELTERQKRNCELWNETLSSLLDECETLEEAIEFGYGLNLYAIELLTIIIECDSNIKKEKIARGMIDFNNLSVEKFVFLCDKIEEAFNK